MTDNTIVWVTGLALAAVTTLPVILRLRGKEKHTDQAEDLARAYGLHEPATLHPVVDPERCIGTSNCVEVCPEGDVIGIRSGQAIAIAPACCIGHGLCERACPMEAIQLVFGTAKRGVDIPRIAGNFETNVPGLFIVGELGGMGLIRNAFVQGRQCIEGIKSELGQAGTGDDGDLDLIIVGCGPAGLSASLTAQHCGLRFITLEREADLGGTVRHYPRKKLVMTAPVTIPGLGKVGSREMIKEDLVEMWDKLSGDAELPVLTGRTVKAIKRLGDVFEVDTGTETHRARYVVLAIGRRGIPRRLGVPGEDLPNVQYGLADAESFQGDRILVVGGGDSAVEAALALAEQPSTQVRVSYRRDAFSRIKPKNRKRIEAALTDGSIEIHWSTQVERIEPGQAWLTPATADTYALPNDQVFVFAGGVLPTPFLESCGIKIDTKFGEV
jgi:thioredoxin reductase/NAD-dependent dihydropyrimidine dehydrogenase PreA subunit